MSSAGSRGTSSRRSRSSATWQPADERLGLLGERRVLAGELAGGAEVVAERLPVPPGADDRRQLGVALVELLGQPGVGVRLGRGQLLLELGVLGEHALDGLEHRRLLAGGADWVADT